MTGARAYVEHLLLGGTTRWADWPDAAFEPQSSVPTWDGELPGAAQAELLRLVNAAWDDPAGAPPDLARRVLARAAPGRGMVDLRLAEPASAPPVNEVIRVASGVLADLVAELHPGQESPGPARRPPRGVRRFVLEGPPLTVAALRDRLAAAGSVEGGGRRLFGVRQGPQVALVVALPLPRALFEVWSHRAQLGSSRQWPAVIGEWRAQHLPAAAAYDRRAALWAQRLGPENVHVITRPGLDLQVEGVLGTRPALRDPGRLPAQLRPVAVDVLRHVNEVLLFRVPEAERKAKLERFVAILREVPVAGPRAIGVPQQHRAWASATAAGIAAELQHGGYQVHGPLRRLDRAGVRRAADGATDQTRRRAPRAPGRWAEADVLAGMVEALIRTARVGAAQGEQEVTR